MIISISLKNCDFIIACVRRARPGWLQCRSRRVKHQIRNRGQMGFWFLLILGMIAFGVGLNWMFTGNYIASTPAFLVAIVLVLLAMAIRKGRT